MSADESHTAPPGRAAGGRLGPPETVRIERLLPSDSPRLDGENDEHARMLAESDSPLPPILVHRQTMRVIDGMHRLRAAVLRGQATVEARFFDGPAEQVFAMAVEANITHGLPLPLRDRECAATRILAEHPEWSDRVIARVSGLSAKTVGGLRRRAASAEAQVVARVGSDGRVRPVNSAERRQSASAFIASKPDATLREIARDAGISVATARDVRERIRRGDDPIPPAQRRPQIVPAIVPSPAPVVPVASVKPSAPPSNVTRLPTRRNAFDNGGSGGADRARSVVAELCKDPSLRFSESGRALLRWLDSRVAEMEMRDRLFDAAPAHSSYLLIEFAQCYASGWRGLADRMQGRIDGAGTATGS